MLEEKTYYLSYKPTNFERVSFRNSQLYLNILINGAIGNHEKHPWPCSLLKGFLKICEVELFKWSPFQWVQVTNRVYPLYPSSQQDRPGGKQDQGHGEVLHDQNEGDFSPLQAM